MHIPPKRRPRAVAAWLLALGVAAGCSSAPAEPPASTLDLPEQTEAWWCESIAEAKALGWSPGDYAAFMSDAFESGAHNAPVSDLPTAALRLWSVTCGIDYARAAAGRMG